MEAALLQVLCLLLLNPLLDLHHIEFLKWVEFRPYESFVLPWSFFVQQFVFQNSAHHLTHIISVRFGEVSSCPARNARLRVKSPTHLVECGDTWCSSLESRLSQIGPHVADDLLEELVDVLIVQVTWNVVASSTSNIDKPIPCDLMS